MKKKPPPGATLIARLKEQRLAREAELAKKQQGGGTAAADENVSDQNPQAQPVAPTEAPPAAEEQSDNHNAVETVVETHEEREVPKSAPVKAHRASEPIETAQPVHATIVVETADMQQALTIAAKSDHNLIRREIDIEDLRPNTDDYFVLTDEIRLAGRFAAVGLIAQGLRLYKLKEAQIYKDHYQTFEEYCRKEHQMSATYAYRLIRMAEMAEQVASLGASPVPQSSEGMPDPFEVMISLGHRHLMALLPLEAETAQELLLKGIPVAEEEGDQRVPLSKATEKQIRDALKALAPAPSKTAVKVVQKKALVSEKQLIPALSKLVEMLEDWALWLDGEPPAELEAARMGRGQLLNRLAKRFRAASGKIADSLEGSEE